MSDIPKSGSEGEELFALHCRVHGLTPVREWAFAKPRRWRFDFCFPKEKLAVEIEGGTWIQGRHNRGSSIEKQYEKQNTAALLGWALLHFTTAQVKSGYAINTVKGAL